jgi:hypothetical protein
MLDPKEEKRFEELRGICRELKVPPPPEIMIGLKVHDKNGILTFDDIQRGHSWNRNFWNTIWGCAADGVGDSAGIFGAGNMSGRQVSGTIAALNSQTASHNNNVGGNYGMSGAATIITGGIVIGTGDTAFDIDQYSLAAQIANATMAHVAMAAFSQSYTALTKTWKRTLVRIFNNNSGSSVTVKETGIYSSATFAFGTTTSVMLERSVLSPTVAVANGAQLTVTYEISMDFSSID